MLLRLFKLLISWGFFAIFANASPTFPNFLAILSSGHTSGLQHSDTEKFSAAADFLDKQNPKSPKPHVFCTDTLSGGPLYQKKLDFENLLGVTLQLVVIDNTDDIVCYSAIISYSDIASKGVVADGKFNFRVLPGNPLR